MQLSILLLPQYWLYNAANVGIRIAASFEAALIFKQPSLIFEQLYNIIWLIEQCTFLWWTIWHGWLWNFSSRRTGFASVIKIQDICNEHRLLIFFFLVQESKVCHIKMAWVNYEGVMTVLPLGWISRGRNFLMGMTRGGNEINKWNVRPCNGALSSLGT